MGIPWKRDLYLPILVLVLLLLCLPITSHDVLAKEPVADAEPAADGSEAPSFCQEVQISSTGAVCKSTYGFIARLDFPWVDLESVIAGEQFLASAETTFSVRDQMIGCKQYRNISFVLRWEPTTPAFLQVYMAALLPSWEDHGESICVSLLT